MYSCILVTPFIKWTGPQSFLFVYGCLFSGSKVSKYVGFAQTDHYIGYQIRWGIYCMINIKNYSVYEIRSQRHFECLLRGFGTLAKDCISSISALFTLLAKSHAFSQLGPFLEYGNKCIWQDNAPWFVTCLKCVFLSWVNAHLSLEQSSYEIIFIELGSNKKISLAGWRLFYFHQPHPGMSYCIISCHIMPCIRHVF